MTATFRAPRARPPASAPGRPANRPPGPRPAPPFEPDELRRPAPTPAEVRYPSESAICPEPLAGRAMAAPEVTVSITVRGEDAISAIAPLVAAVKAIGSAEVIVDAASPGEWGRRRGAELSTNATAAADAAALHIVVDEYNAMLDGAPLNLTRREFDLLCFLARHPRRVFSRSQLLQTVWGYEFSGGGRTVDVHVRRLRQKLGGRGPAISTIRGVGYRLDEPERVALVDR